MLHVCNYDGTMNTTRWWGYVTETAGNVTNTEIADRVGIDKSNVTRWSKGSNPRSEFAIQFARAYGQPVVTALVAAGYITDQEAGLRTVKIGVEDLSSKELASELLRRIEDEEAAPSNVIVGGFGKTDSANTGAEQRVAHKQDESDTGEDEF